MVVLHILSRDAFSLCTSYLVSKYVILDTRGRVIIYASEVGRRARAERVKNLGSLRWRNRVT